MAKSTKIESVYSIKQIPLEKPVMVKYVENFMDEKRATNLFEWCMKNLEFSDHKVKIYGKELLQPRKTCVVGTRSYTYSGSTLKGTPMPAEFDKIIEDILLFLPEGHVKPNTVLCNLYQTGNEYISQHSDTEKNLIPGSSIVGLSLGAVRHFDLVSKETRLNGESEKYRIDLAHGSIIVMGEGCQAHYKHGIPIQRAVRKPRINLTFRAVKIPI